MNQVSEIKTEAVEQVSSYQAKSQSNDKKNDCCVQVAVRVRPFINKELVDCESSIVKCSKSKITIGADKDFEFDRVIDQEAIQEDVYKWCVNDLLLKIFEGYNATILAYGQTGSGKTFTMGTSNASLNDINEMGIIPRVIREIFKIRRERENSVDMILKISYFEIYNDNIIDLLDPNTIAGANAASNSKKGKGSNNGNNIFIREEADGSINLYGITEEKVNSPEEMLAALERGGLCRSTSATLMNQTSSRSHAVFTIFLEQHSIEDLYKNADGSEVIGDSEGGKNVEAFINEGFKTSKFHFVDLAGSERIKKTGAVGNTLKEGININMGLLSLGNVISALTEPQKSGAPKKHIPYRDSKLTRILQDSLGGNSNTLMIACVSPAESNFEESLNTLKYASRARRIKNKPIVNRDPQSALISSLKQQVQEANLEIAKYRQLLIQNNIQIPDNMNFGQNLSINQENYNQIRRVSQDLLMFKQTSNGNVMYQLGNEAEMEELKQLRINQVKLEKKIKELQAENGSLKSHSYKGEIEILTIQRERDEYRLKLEKIVKFAKEKGIFSYQTQVENDGEQEQTKVDVIYLNAEGEPEIQIDITQKSLIDEYSEKLENIKNQIKKKDQEYREVQIEFDEGIKASLRDQQMLIEREKKINFIQRNLKNKESELKKIKDELQNLKKSKVKLMSKSSIKIQDEENNIKHKLSIANLEDDDTQNADTIQNENDEDDEEIYGEEFEKITSDPEFVKMESQLKIEEDEKKIKISKVNGSIQEKSEEFRKLNQNQLVLQKQLLEKMKEQYHQKINNLEFDMKKMENQRDEALQKLSNSNTKEAVAEKQRVIESFKQKVTEMQLNLNEYKKKAREQETLSKTVQIQEKQIQQLGSEITKFKSLKTNLYKEMKKNNEEFEKYKLKKYKEFMQEKKKNIEKEKKIFKLQNQTKKQERLLQKKQEEFNKLIRSRDLIKKIISSSSQSSVIGVRGKMAHQRVTKKQKIEIAKVDDQNDNLDSSLNSPNNKISVENFNDYPIDEALDMCLCKLIESIEIQLNIEKAEDELKMTLQELEDAQQKSIEFKINLEKRERGISEIFIGDKKYEDNILGDELMEQQQQQLDQQKMELEEIQSRLESLEAKYEFKKEKISNLYADQRSSNFEVLQNQLLTSAKYNNLQTQKVLLKQLLEKFDSSTTENLRNQEKIETLNLQIDDSQQFIQLLQNQKDISQNQMQQQIDQLQQQIQIALSQQQVQTCQYDSDTEINQTMEDQNMSLMNSSSINMHIDGRRINKNQGSPHKQIASNRYKSMRLAHQAEQSPYRKEGKNSEDYAKLQQKQINDLTKQLKQNELRVKTLQNKNETLQQKYDDLKKANCKNKFIGINKQNIEDELIQIGQMNNSMINSQQLLNGSMIQSISNVSLNQAAAQANNNTSMINSTLFQQQMQSLNTVKTFKEVAIQSLKERRRDAKGKSGNHENTPQNNTNTALQNSPPQSSTLLKSISKKQYEQQNQSLILNNEGSQSSLSSFASKTQAQQLAQKRLQLNEARKKKYSQQSQKLQQYIQQQSQIPHQFQQSYQQFGMNIYQQDNNVRGGNTVGSTPNLDYNLAQQSSVIENESESPNKYIDNILDSSTENNQSQQHSLGFNLESPTKSLEQSCLPLSINNNYSPSESQDLTNNQLQQNQVQFSVKSINKIINENSHNNLSNSLNTLNLIAELGSSNQYPNSLNYINNNYGSGFKNSLESNSNGIQSPGEENSFSCKYECVGKINDAHSGQVFCMQSYENFFFSTSVKSLKIWDLETLKCISDIQAHNHFVKGLAILEQEKWIATACDKYINIWDMVSLQKICTLTGHNTDIKQLYVDNNHVLYSVGKGANNFGALVTWDIRKQSVIDEREKNQDIFSVLPYNNIIYYASRDHYVRRINMDNNQSIDPFKPPHYDAVTSLAILNGYLVSGSKDHNLKLWNTQPFNSSFKQQTYYSNEQIMCLESNKDRNLLYVGQKDGKIRVLTTQNNKFKDVSDINNGLQSVNCITKIQNNATENMFACGTADKFIKIWKPAQDSSQSMSQLKNLNAEASNLENQINNYISSPFQLSQNDQNVIIDEL